MEPTQTEGGLLHLVTDPAKIARIALRSHRVAVLGIKTEAQAGQPAFEVPRYLQQAGVEVIPVPIYYPDVTTILGRRVYRRVADIPGGPVDLVDVFIRPKDLASHLDDLLKAMPKAVWFQSGIRDDAVAEALARAGIDVVQDRCLMVDHRLAVMNGGA